MKFLRNTFIAAMLTFIMILGCIFYAFKIEPYRVKIKNYTLNEQQTETEGIKIIQISDIHVKADYTYTNLKKVVDKINKQKPDIVIFTGDLYDNYAVYHDDQNVISQLKNIEAKYDKIAVWGNRDYGGGAVRRYEQIMGQAGFKLLKNENRGVTLDSGRKILFTGLDDVMLGNPYLPEAEKTYRSDYRILLSHEPDAVIQYLNADYDLILSGHSHGGQMNIPLFPVLNERAVAVTKFSDSYSSGMYTLNQQKKLYVNTGLGTTHISARFGVVPEIAVFQIYL